MQLALFGPFHHRRKIPPFPAREVFFRLGRDDGQGYCGHRSAEDSARVAPERLGYAEIVTKLTAGGGVDVPPAGITLVNVLGEARGEFEQFAGL